MRTRVSWIPRLLLASITLAGIVRADEIIVDPRGLGDQLTIGDALAAASQGDTILVRPGTYVEDVTIDGTAVHLVAQHAGTVELRGRLTIRLIDAGDLVLLDGMQIMSATEGGAALHVLDCDGDVRVQRCTIRGYALAPGGATAAGGTAARIERSARVTVRRSSLRGGSGTFQNVIGGYVQIDGGVGLQISDAGVALFGVEALGGDGADTFIVDVGETLGRGGPGLRVERSNLLLSGCTVRGGGGGGYSDALLTFPPGGDGGDGLVALDGARVFSLESQRTGGQGGLAGSQGATGAQGQGTVNAFRVRDLAGRAEDHDTPLFVRGQSVHPVEVRGEPGAEAILYITARAPFVFDGFDGPSPGGSAPTSPVPTAPIPLGTIPATGVLQASLGIPAVPPGATLLGFDFLIVTRAGASRSSLGAPQRVLVVQCGNLAPDCDGNGRSDLCELLEGTPDCDGDGVLDSCQVDCNANGLPDPCDIAAGTSLDRNGNGVPDECDPIGATWFVDAAAAPGGVGSAALPFRSLTEAFGAALSGDEVIVRDGVYRGADNRGLAFGGREFTVRSENGPSGCVLDLDRADRAFVFDTGAGATGARIEGLTLLDGSGAQGPQFGLPESSGGAILILETGGHPTIFGCVFEGNFAYRGGAIYAGSAETSVPRIEGCTFRNGSAVEGGGLHFRRGGGLVEACSFLGNSAGELGAAIYGRGNGGPGITISRSRFLENRSTAFGGSVWLTGSAATPGVGPDRIDQCLFAGNTAQLAAGVGLRERNVVVANCTLVGNAASWRGGAIEVGNGAVCELVNSIVVGNTASQGAQLTLIGDRADLVLGYSNLEGGASGVFTVQSPTLTVGAGVIDQDPRFTSPLGPDGIASTFFDNDYSLGAGSPSTDAGDVAAIPPDVADVNGNSDVVEPVPLDLAGAPRRRDDPAVPDTGSGGAPVVDHGPFER